MDQEADDEQAEWDMLSQIHLMRSRSVVRQNLLGSVFKDERMCCECRYAPQKRHCCYCTVLLVLLGDITILVYIIVNYLHLMDLIEEYAHDDPDNLRVGRRWIVRQSLSMWATNLLVVFKIFFAIRWVCKPTRRNFLPYYRLSMTLSISSLMTCIQFFLLAANEETRYYLKDAFLVIGIGIFTMTIVTIHINYMDKVHFEQNELLKDKQIMTQYIRTLEKSQSHYDS